jgi:prepilin-type N-terminal cleavage/methylation domain-containing protein
MKRRGFTLVEVLIAVAIFVTVTAGAFAFASQQMKTRKLTEFALDTEQNARVVMDSLRQDLQLAGLGMGYLPDGNFSGVTLGGIDPAGTQFRSTDFVMGAAVSDDIRIRGTVGPSRSVATYDPAAGQFEICGGAFPEWAVVGQPAELAVLVSESYADARVIEITNVNLGIPCTDSQCLATPTGYAVGSTCDRITYIDRSDVYATDAAANGANYSGGTLFRNFFDSLYFVNWAGGVPSVFKADLTRDAAGTLLPSGTPPICWASRATCATNNNLLGENVESLQMRLWYLLGPTDPPKIPNPAGEPRDLINFTNGYAAAGAINNRNRVRVDVEVIARARAEERAQVRDRVCSSLNPASCFPAVGFDFFKRRVQATTVELKNTGAMSFGAL